MCTLPAREDRSPVWVQVDCSCRGLESIPWIDTALPHMPLPTWGDHSVYSKFPNSSTVKIILSRFFFSGQWPIQSQNYGSTRQYNTDSSRDCHSFWKIGYQTYVQELYLYNIWIHSFRTAVMYALHVISQYTCIKQTTQKPITENFLKSPIMPHNTTKATQFVMEFTPGKVLTRQWQDVKLSISHFL